MCDMTIISNLKIIKIQLQFRIEHLNEAKGEDPYIAMINKLALEDKLEFETAKFLISEYKKSKEVGN